MIKNTQYEPDLPYPYLIDIRKSGTWSIYKAEAILEADRFLKSEERRLVKQRINHNRSNYRKRK